MTPSELIFIILSLCGRTLQDSEISDRNKEVDYIVDQARYYLTGAVKLQDTSFHIPFLAAVDLKEGSLYGLTSLSRFGDVQVLETSMPGWFEVAVNLRFGAFSVVYGKYEIRVTFLDVNHGEAETKPNDAMVRVNFVYGDSICNLKVKQVKFLKFDNFHLQLNSKCKLCAKVSDIVFEQILHIFNSLIKEQVEEKIASQIAMATGKYRDAACGPNAKATDFTFNNLVDLANGKENALKPNKV